MPLVDSALSTVGKGEKEKEVHISEILAMLLVQIFRCQQINC